ncbi:hypothetical protein CERSUDRAFT_110364 [Gelatoporia subvermispora B]|uniref:Amino acid transporter transmembrane domain-containing protein n=1 Tax=Ceriporiopsis subvermispora (strain B) TaxID=914234 RepID=M2PY19_CERS8|nr:hypothetical protein CERSUDRAFT_110364 [Gelatoporia subvermispora B]
MSSLPATFNFGSLHSTVSVRDAIASYRRAQGYLSDAAAVSISAPSDGEGSERNSLNDEELETGIGSRAAVPQGAAFQGISSLQWDEDLPPSPSGASRGGLAALRHTSQQYAAATESLSTKAKERTPLLKKATSTSILEGQAAGKRADYTRVAPSTRVARVAPRNSRTDIPKSTVEDPHTGVTKLERYNYGGQSTFGQTLFNSIAILFGIGMLSEPLAFAYAGWIGGAILITFYGCVTCYTAKLLARIILADPRLKTYSDIGRKAFGPRSVPVISFLFCLELFTVSVALITLYADSLHAVLPSHSVNTYKLLGFVILVPTVLMPLSVLSYASILGLLSTLLIIAVILVDGLSKYDPPGSLWSHMPTNMSFQGWSELGISFGLFMAGFSGHAVIPSLARDMIDPSQFDTMIDYAFVIASAIYATIGVAGYLMFGNDVSDEFSQDLIKYSIYPSLNKVALWGLVLTPLSKFALSTRPLNIMLEVMLGIDTSTRPSEDHTTKPPTSDSDSDARTPSTARPALKRAFTVVERVVFTMLSTAVSILVPEFGSMMAFLGAFSAFIICVIGPVSAQIALTGRCSVWDASLLASGIVMASWGTFAALWSPT